MTDCLYECLKEAHLDRYYPNFIQRGLHNCESLVSLSMPDYPRYGIVSMEDRLHLFKLIQIIKSIQGEGMVCQHTNRQNGLKHGVTQSEQNNGNVTIQGNRPKEVLVKKGASVGGMLLNTNSASVPFYSSGQQQQQTKEQSTNKSTNLQGQPLFREKPLFHWNQKTKKSPEVIFRKGSDSPIFKCRKTLRFTDSECESSDDEAPQVKKESSSTGPVQTNTAPHTSVTEATEPRAFFIDAKPKSNNLTRETSISCTAMHASPLKQAPIILSKEPNVCHAYFPHENTSKEQKPVYVEKVHHGTGYDYGVPTTPHMRTKVNDNDKVGKIQVCIRKRPLTAAEVKRKELDVVKANESTSVVVNEPKMAVDLTPFVQQHIFHFDQVFDSNCSNEDIYKTSVRPLVKCIFNRGTATCFAFGQTGAGKTYTLLGSKGVPGLYQLAGQDIFGTINEQKAQNSTTRRMLLWISYFEIYCGQLFDLLNKRKKLHVRENGKQKVCITGLAETRVQDVRSLVEVIQYGNIARSTGSTGVNPHSSRSHAVLQMEVRDFKDSRVGRLSFIDLAGSERASDVTEFDRQTRIEGAEINQSLLALKECIRSIDQDNKHTPYRQSKLTHILRESFVGNSQTVMIANIAPSQSCCENTLNTLRYADRVKELKKDGRSFSRNTPRMSKSSQHQTSNRTLRRTPPSLFHPSKIPFSSTPKAKISPKNSGEDLNEILQNADESPIQGHQIQRIRLQKKHRSRICHSDNASSEGSYGDHLKHSDVNNNNGDLVEKLNTEQKAKSDFAVKTFAANSEVRMHSNSVIVKETLSDTDISKCGSFGLLQKEEESLPKKRSQSHGSLCVCEQELVADRQLEKQHMSSSPASSHSAHSDNELIEGHLAIINHLDRVLSKAKSVVNKMSPKSSSASSPGEQASFGSSKSSYTKAHATQDAVPFRRTLFRDSHSSTEHSSINDRQQDSGSVCSQKSAHERASELRLYPQDAPFHGSRESSLERSDGSGMAQKWITQGESRHSSTNDHLETDKYTPSNMSDSGNATSGRDGQRFENRSQPATGIKVDEKIEMSHDNAWSTGTMKFEGKHLYYRGGIEPKALFQPDEPQKSVQFNDISGIKNLQADKGSWDSENDVVIEVHAKDMKLFTEEDEFLTQTLESAALPSCENNHVTERGEPVLPLNARDNCTTEKMKPNLPVSTREFPQHKAFTIEKHADKSDRAVLANSDAQTREPSSMTIRQNAAMHTGGSSRDIPVTSEADGARSKQNVSESEVATNLENSGLSSGGKFQSVMGCEYKQESDVKCGISDDRVYAHQQTHENVKVGSQERSSPEQLNSWEKRSWASVLSQSNESHSLQSSQDSGISTFAQPSASSMNLLKHDQPRNERLASHLAIHTDSAFTAVSSTSQDKSHSQLTESSRNYSSYSTTRSASFSQAETAFIPIEPCSTTLVDKHKIAVPVVVTKTILTCHSDMDTRECTKIDADHKSDVQALCSHAAAQTAQPNQGQCCTSMNVPGESNRNPNVVSKLHSYSQMQQKTDTNLDSDKMTISIRSDQLHEFHNKCPSTRDDPNFIRSGQGQNVHGHHPSLGTQGTSSQAVQSISSAIIHTRSTNDDRLKHEALLCNRGNEQQPAGSENVQPAIQPPVPQLQSSVATEQSVITQAQNELIAQHEEQLSALIALCKQEMRLLIDVKSGTSDFAKYLSVTKSIQNTKTQSVNSLMSGIDQYLHLVAKHSI